jgi:hypothetical protein
MRHKSPARSASLKHSVELNSKRSSKQVITFQCHKQPYHIKFVQTRDRAIGAVAERE